MDIKTIIFGVLGGLGLFLFGMKSMSEGLQRVAGARLRKILEVLTKNRLVAVGVGAGVTAVVQSSSTVTVMTVGFVNAGLMSLKQAVGVVLGANIGTTITAQIIAFKIHKFALPAIGIGAFILLFSKKQNLKYIGQILFGFGLLFFGLHIMKDTFMFLKKDPSFANLFVIFSKNPFIAVLAGALLTFVIQSSSATIGITIALAVTGVIDFQAAFPLVLGENIGTTITAQIAAIGASITARRTAMAHTLFNLIGTMYMLALFYIRIDGVPVFLMFIDMITPGDVNAAVGNNIDRHIANAHSLFNIFNVLVFIPLVVVLAKICEIIIPGDTDIVESGTKFIDERFLDIPSTAIEQAKQETVRMAEIAKKAVAESIIVLHDPKQNKKDKVFQQEQLVDDLQKDIMEYLIKIEEHDLDEQNQYRVAKMMSLVHEIEKISDHAVNIVQLTDSAVNNKLTFSDEAMNELKEMESAVDQVMELAIKSFSESSITYAQKTIECEVKIDQFKTQLRDNYIKRLTNKKEKTASGIIFADIVNNLERIGDHANKLAKAVLRRQV